jgi:hypothetical protein
MNKQQALQKMMIPVSVRKPDPSDGDVLTWNPKVKRYAVQDAAILRVQLAQSTMGVWKGKDDPNLFHTGYYVTHWARLYPFTVEET